MYIVLVCIGVPNTHAVCPTLYNQTQVLSELTFLKREVKEMKGMLHKISSGIDDIIEDRFTINDYQHKASEIRLKVIVHIG